MSDKTDNALVRFIHDETAATAVEYGLIAAGIAVAIAGVIATLGGNVKAMWTTVKNAVG